MIRRATHADLAAIMRIEHAVFPTDAWSEAMMRDELASPHGWYAVLQLGGAVVGYGGLRSIRGATDADVQTLAVDSGARGRGHGRMLLRALLREAAHRGAAEVFLEVRADNPVAQSLYQAEGFAQVGRRPRYYQPDDVDALVMRLDLPAWTANHPAPAHAPAPAATPAPGATPAHAPAPAATPAPGATPAHAPASAGVGAPGAGAASLGAGPASLGAGPASLGAGPASADPGPASLGPGRAGWAR